ILVFASVASLLLILSVPTAARQVPRNHPGNTAPTRPALTHGNRARVRPTGVPANSSDPEDLVSPGGFAWVAAYSPAPPSALWKSSTFTTTAIKDNIEPFELVWAGNKLFFVASDGTHGDELWVSNGTNTSTHQIKDAVLGPDGLSIYDMVAVGNKVYFQAD